MLEVCVAIIKENGKYLICQRAGHDAFTHLWEFPGGKREAGESKEECIVREIFEELEVRIEVEDVYADIIHEREGKNINLTFFMCSIISGEIKRNVHENIKWVNAKEFNQYPFLEADKEILENLALADSLF